MDEDVKEEMRSAEGDFVGFVGVVVYRNVVVVESDEDGG